MNKLDNETLKARYDAALVQIEKGKTTRSGETTGVMLLAASFSEASDAYGLEKAAFFAKFFCINFAMIAAVLLFWQVGF